MGRDGRKIIYKTAEEIELIRESCLLDSKTLAYVGSLLRPGMTGQEVDLKAEEFIRDHGAVPGFKGLYGCPSTLLISRNEAVVHGLPSEKQVFQDGDILSIDCGVLMNDYYGDCAYTFCIGEVEEKTLQLCKVTNESLYRGIEQAVIGNRVGDISFAIQHYTEKEHPYSVVRELVGHGLGRSMHEAPDVANYGKRGQGPRIQEGMVIAIEPMINLGKKQVRTLSDDWTIVTRDKKPSAHYEHTIAVTKNGPDILTSHEIIIEEIEKNPNVHAIVRDNVALEK